MKKLMITLGIFLILSNLPPIKPLLEMFFTPPYRYVTRDQMFKDGYENNRMGKSYDEVMLLFDQFKQEHNQPNAVLYRKFTIKPYKFWLWGDYLFHPKYRLPYLATAKN